MLSWHENWEMHLETWCSLGTKKRVDPWFFICLFGFCFFLVVCLFFPGKRNSTGNRQPQMPTGSVYDAYLKEGSLLDMKTAQVWIIGNPSLEVEENKEENIKIRTCPCPVGCVCSPQGLHCLNPTWVCHLCCRKESMDSVSWNTVYVISSRSAHRKNWSEVFTQLLVWRSWETTKLMSSLRPRW